MVKGKALETSGLVWNVWGKRTNKLMYEYVLWYIKKNIYIYIHTIYVYIYIYMYTCICIYTRKYIHIYIYTYMRTCIRICICICICIWTNLDMRLDTNVVDMHIYIYIYISSLKFPLQFGRGRPSYKCFIMGHFVITTSPLTKAFCNRMAKKPKL